MEAKKNSGSPKTIYKKNYGTEMHSVSLHDCLLTFMRPDIENRTLEVEFVNYYQGLEKKYKFIFEGTVYFEMTNHWSWGPSNYIYALRFENEDLIQKRFLEAAKQDGTPDFECACKLMEEVKDAIFGPCITFISGDSLRIACTSIEIYEYDLE